MGGLQAVPRMVPECSAGQASEPGTGSLRPSPEAGHSEPGPSLGSNHLF